MTLHRGRKTVHPVGFLFLLLALLAVAATGMNKFAAAQSALLAWDWAIEVVVKAVQLLA